MVALMSVRASVLAAVLAVATMAGVAGCGSSSNSQPESTASDPVPSASAPTASAAQAPTPTPIEPGLARPTEKSLPANWPKAVPAPPDTTFVGAASSSPAVAVWVSSKDVAAVRASMSRALTGSGFSQSDSTGSEQRSTSWWIKGDLSVRVVVAQGEGKTSITQTVGG